jgi:uridine kinase
MPQHTMNSTPARPFLIGVAGPSCAGKSYLATHLAEKLGAALFHMDWYYRELDHLPLAERHHFNFDEPAALESELMISHLRHLAEGRPIARPVYDFATHTRTGEHQPLAPQPFLIVEGLFALHWEPVRALLGTRVYVDLGEEVCLQRRIERDIRERGRSRQSVLEQYHATVLPMAKLYVHPTRAHADVVVTGNQPIADEVDAVLRHISAPK